MDGELGAVYREWSSRLLRVLAQLEALIDFPDEDLPPEVAEAGRREVAALASEIRVHLDDGRRGEMLRDGLVFAVTGPPNAGKSTLVNALAGRDVAIVAASPGTTRDVLEVRVVLGGVPVTLLDTAGLREAVDPVEAEGVRRALARADAADVVIAVRDDNLERDTAFSRSGIVVSVQTKIDLGEAVRPEALGVSVVTGSGLAALRDRLAELARSLTVSCGPPALTRARHRTALAAAAERLEQAGFAVLPELQAEDARLALRAFGRVTGSVGVEDVLDSVFGQFCIGK
jgi:tRNA modification GTPase